jgi:hypothetical protein
VGGVPERDPKRGVSQRYEQWLVRLALAKSALDLITTMLEMWKKLL